MDDPEVSGMQPSGSTPGPDTTAPSDIGPIETNYNKIGMVTFVVLSIIGILFAIIPLVSLAFLVLFVISYLKIRGAKKQGLFTYTFILSAPSTISSILFFLVPSLQASPALSG